MIARRLFRLPEGQLWPCRIYESGLNLSLHHLSEFHHLHCPINCPTRLNHDQASIFKPSFALWVPGSESNTRIIEHNIR